MGARFLFVHDGRDLIGTVRDGDEAAEAFDARGNRLGKFSTAKAAIAAINSSWASSCVPDTAGRMDGGG